MDEILRYDNNKIDTILLHKYFSEFKRVLSSFEGLSDVNDYRREFEREFEKVFSLHNAVAVGCGTDALHLALLALDIKKGDEIIIPALSYISAPLITRFVGASIVLVDVNKKNLTLDIDEVKKAITKKTKAIIAVHMFGHLCDMDPLQNLCEKNGIEIIEDCCQAIGSTYHGKSVGSFGILSAFSFSFNKPFASLGGSGGGMIVGKNEQGRDKIKKYIEISMGSKKLLELGVKFRKMQLLEIGSVRIKLRYHELIFKSREELKIKYEKELKEIEIFIDENDIQSVKETYIILCRKRDELYEHLKTKGIVCQLPYKPVHYTEICSSQSSFPVTEQYYSSGLHLPLFTFMKMKEVEHVCVHIRRFYS